MSLLVLGLNFRTAPVALLEKVAVPADELQKALASLLRRAHVIEAAVLSTCNRVEVYANVTRYHGGMGDLRAFFSEWAGVAPEDFAHLAYDFYAESAAAHLFGVASGLDSMVVGERQIHLQVKAAYLAAEQEETAGRLLGEVFRQALRVGRRTRAETGIGAGAASIVDLGLAAAERALGSLDGRVVAVVGAGKIGGMGAGRVADRAREIVIVNRSLDKAERLAHRVGGRTLPLSQLRHALRDADLVLTSTGSSGALITPDTLGERGGRPLVLVDLAVPRDVLPACADLPGVTLVDIDGLRSVAEVGRTGEEVAKARSIVDEEARGFAAWQRGVEVAPTIAALRTHAETIRAEEWDRLRHRFAALDDRQRAAVETLSRRIVNSLLHTPSVRLKALAGAPDGAVHAAALGHLFDLPAGLADDPDPDEDAS